MEWGSDFSPNRKAPPRRGRRAGIFNQGSAEEGDIGSTDDLLDSPSSSAASRSMANMNVPVAPPRSRRTGGWADEATKSGKRRSAVNLIEQERFRTPEDRNDSDDDIPVIPDLDDYQDEDMASQIAQAPSVAVNRVAAYKELDSDLFKHATFATLDDVNLRLLTKCLNLESEIKETDTPWTWDLLFTDVASELHYEWENQSKSNAEKDSGTVI